MSNFDLDILIATDCRLPGGTAASVAEEIRAQSQAGFRTGLLHLPSHLVAGELPFNYRLLRCLQRGDAELVVGRRAVRARALVVRQPKILTEPFRADPPRIDSDVRLMVANHTPRDRSGRRRFYDPAVVQHRLGTAFGGSWLWAPIGPAVRRSLEAAGAPPMIDEDWVNVIDVGRWAADRRAPIGRPIVLGRHGRDSWDKWPATAEDLLAAYPERSDIEVRILGGAETAERLLGRRPSNWVVYPYGAMAPEDFLAGIDVFVYFPHRDSLEAFGRTILEAIASGAVAVLPERFHGLFAEAATYRSPPDVLATILELASDPPAYEDTVTRARMLVHERFSYATHRRRLEALIGPATSSRRAVETASSARRPRPADRTRILFMSSNGAGVGHLMRLMAMARRVTEDVQPIFLTLSQATWVVGELGFDADYLMSSGYSGMGHAEWNAYLRRRLEQLVRRHRPAALVFDGTYPWRPILELKNDHPEVRLIWSRRGMWRPDADIGQLPHADRFDLIIEPGEIAAPADAGPTRHRDDALRVGPVLLVDEREQLSTEEARVELGLDPGRPAALVQLGAGNINDVGSTLGIVVDRLGRVDDLQVCVAESAITEEPSVGVPVHRLSVYPLARYLRAFDLAVSAAGYNSYHELITTGVPTIFIPNLETATDDQAARARFAEDEGAGLALFHPHAAAIERAVDAILDPDRRAEMSQRCRELSRGNGADGAVRAILATARAPEPTGAPGVPGGSPRGTYPRRSGATRIGGVAHRIVASFVRFLRALYAPLPEPVKAALRPLVRAAPTSLTRRGERTAWHGDRPIVLFVVLDLGDDITDVVDEVARLRTATAAFEPLFVTSARDLSPFRRHRSAIEFVTPSDRWSGDPEDWGTYVRTQLRSIVTTHRPIHTVTVDPDGRPLREPWFPELLISLRTD